MSDQPHHDADEYTRMPRHMIHWRPYVTLPNGQLARICVVPLCQQHPNHVYPPPIVGPVDWVRSVAPNSFLDARSDASTPTCSRGSREFATDASPGRALRGHFRRL